MYRLQSRLLMKSRVLARAQSTSAVAEAEPPLLKRIRQDLKLAMKAKDRIK